MEQNASYSFGHSHCKKDLPFGQTKSSIYCIKEDLHIVENTNMFCIFLFSGKPDPTIRNTIQLDYLKGGIKMKI